jgi:hypothetical protein
MQVAFIRDELQDKAAYQAPQAVLAG